MIQREQKIVLLAMEHGVCMSNIIQADKNILVDIAKASILHGLQKGKALSVNELDYNLFLQSSRATFVTLNMNKQLRGCIGSLVAHRPLISDIAHNAYAAAFLDPRFAKLSEQEFSLLDYHISILSPSEEMTFISENDFLDQLCPYSDGLILIEGQYQSTFLPSVWEKLPDKISFLSHLKQKAGLAADYWSDSIQFRRYSVDSFKAK